MDIYQELGFEVDAAIDDRNVGGIEGVLSKIEALLSDTHPEDPTLLYFRANCFAGLRQIIRTEEADLFDWNQPELSQEILSLRRSIRSDEFSNLDRIRRCQILTNLGNALSTVGRPIDAIAAWDEALRLEPRFAMASANRAYGILSYNSALYDAGHQCIFFMVAADSFRMALDDNAVFDSDHPSDIKEQFSAKLEEVEQYMDVQCKLDDFNPYGFELGKCDEAIALNRWRLENRLFLNPLNDLAAWPVAAQDVFHLPNHTYEFDERPVYPQYFDLMKQEYVAACVLLYESLDDQETHLADRTLLTYEHADYSVTSVQIEKRKTAFRMAYSILDKCAVFINAYFALGHNPKSTRTSFRNIWFDGKKGALHRNLPEGNWRLRGLYAISLDLYDPHFKETSSPLALTAHDARNAAEHRFLSVHEFLGPIDPDECLERVTIHELDELAMQGLKLARAAMMGLSLAVHHHEWFLKQSSGDKLMMPIMAVPKER